MLGADPGAEAPCAGRSTRARATLVTVAAAAIAVDVASKVAAVRYLDGNPIPLGDVLTLRLLYNPGVAFGVGSNAPAPFVIGLTGLAVLGIVVMAWRGDIRPPAAAGLVVGGGLANLGDRVTGGSVVDMFDLGWWPVFNLADVLLLTGVGLTLLLAHRRKPDADAHPESAAAIEGSAQPPDPAQGLGPRARTDR